MYQKKQNLHISLYFITFVLNIKNRLLLMIKKCCLLILCLYFSAPLFSLPKHEVRAVWLSTIYGLDWPQVRATDEVSTKAQQAALCGILDKLKAANFNTVFLQTRLRGNLIYPSKIESFNFIFSGRAGVAPSYDPLAFAIEECHKRGMECHAWFVTFPIGTLKSVKAQGKSSVVSKHPKLCKKHGGEWYLDPGVPGTIDYLSSLVKEVVTNYNIDGIQFDYIRYPEEAHRFPDKYVHTKYGKGSKRDDWRRENINRLVFRLYDEVKAIKPWVQVSSSPLGKYNDIEKVPNAGWTAYRSVHQDPVLWLKEGKHDMIAPMMYYQNNNFYPFVDNWVENSHGRIIIPGLGAYRMDKKESDWSTEAITEQIKYSRDAATAGCAYFRCGNVLDNSKGLYNQLKDSFYMHPAMLPPLTWLNDTVPNKPAEVQVERIGSELRLTWNPPLDAKDSLNHNTLTYTLYYSMTDSIDTNINSSIIETGIRANEIYLQIDTIHEQIYSFQVTASSRYRMESEASNLTLYYQSKYIK
jgi:uncharacterized lipoprotein YddW (UPF0748 family)